MVMYLVSVLSVNIVARVIKRLFLGLSFCLVCAFFGTSQSSAAQSLLEYSPDTEYYPYKHTFADVYLGLGLASIADVSTYTAGNPRWNALYSPFGILNNYGADFFLGLRPFNKVVFLRGFRIQAGTQYKESRYEILQDTTKNDWVEKNKMPKYGKIALKNVALVSLFYDIRWFSNLVYPYVGAGFGVGTVDVSALDFTLLPDGIGEWYYGEKQRTPIKEFIAGLQYDTKIIKSSLFVQYAYETTGSVKVRRTHNGKDNPEDKDPLPPGFKEPPLYRNINFSTHSIVFGVKFYLF